jgi:Cys-tRNA(Pro) deacylase
VTDERVERVKQALEVAGSKVRVFEVPASTATSVDAARVIGTELSTIVKSILIMADNNPVLVLTGGDRRVDKEKVGALFGASKTRLAGPDEVVQLTGFRVGGVAPVGHRTPMPIVLDRRLYEHRTVYASAGTAHAVFGVDPAELERITGARVEDVTV